MSNIVDAVKMRDITVMRSIIDTTDHTWYWKEALTLAIDGDNIEAIDVMFENREFRNDHLPAVKHLAHMRKKQRLIEYLQDQWFWE
jgi:hypothetical protein